MISNELLEEVIYTSLKNEYIGKELITRIILDSVSNMDEVTKKFLNDIEFCKIDLYGACALCNIETGNLKIDLLQIKNYEKQQSRYSMLSCNLEILQIIIHELKHLQSNYIMTLNNIESKLIEISNYDYIYKNCLEDAKKKTSGFIQVNKLAKKLYSDYRYNNFEIIPDERLAEVGSFEILIEAICKYYNFKLNYTQEYKFLLKEYKRALCSAYSYREKYDNYSSTLIKYLISINRLDLLSYLGLNLKVSGLNNLSGMDLTTKMKYGLPISSLEYNSLNKILTKKY